MIKKFILKLVNYVGIREDLSARNFQTDQKDQAKVARDNLKQIMESHEAHGERKHNLEETTERKPPTEAKILSPSDSRHHE